jgi:hypothetical protein
VKLTTDMLIPADLMASLRTHGFAKIAAAHRGLPDLADKTVLTHLGTKLAERQLQQKVINKGLAALKALQEK